MDALERSPASVSLALLGSGSEAEVLKKRHGASARLHCTGKFVGRKEVALAFAAADASVAASTMETIGLTAMESLHTGTPCLFANAGGFAEHLTHDVNSRLFTPGDPASFDRELEALMTVRREGCWAPEALRDSMAEASLTSCTDRVLEHVYSKRRTPRPWFYPLAVVAGSILYLVTVVSAAVGTPDSAFRRRLKGLNPKSRFRTRFGRSSTA